MILFLSSHPENQQKRDWDHYNKSWTYFIRFTIMFLLLKKIFSLVFISFLVFSLNLLGKFDSFMESKKLSEIICVQLPLASLLHDHSAVVQFHSPTKVMALHSLALPIIIFARKFYEIIIRKNGAEEKPFMTMIIRLHFLCLKQLFESYFASPSNLVTRQK